MRKPDVIHLAANPDMMDYELTNAALAVTWGPEVELVVVHSCTSFGRFDVNAEKMVGRQFEVSSRNTFNFGDINTFWDTKLERS